MATILVVEQSVELRQFLSELLTTEGYAVVTAAGAVDARRSLASKDVHLILAEAGFSASQVLLSEFSWLREYSGQVPTILLGSVPSTFDAVAELGAVAVLPKPFELDELLDRIGSSIR